MCVLCVERERERVSEREDGVQYMPTAAWLGIEKTGFVYADAQTVHLAYLLHTLLCIYCQT